VPDASDAETFRFLGRLGQPIALRDRPAIRWRTWACTIDALGLVPDERVPMDLKRDQVYEVRFLTRARALPSRAAVIAAAEAWGLHVEILSLLQGDLRLEIMPGASHDLWYARGLWTKGDSVTTIEDPFAILDATAVLGTPQASAPSGS
jgi:hypothetical protein